MRKRPGLETLRTLSECTDREKQPGNIDMSWVSTTRRYVSTLPVLKFPFETLPEIYAPQYTVLELSTEYRVHPYQWCYLQRRARAGFTELDTGSLSTARVEAMPKVIDRWSQWVRFHNPRPSTLQKDFGYLSLFLSWADAAGNGRRFEYVLTDADLTLEALKKHHAYLRQLFQRRLISGATASRRDQIAIKILSEVHDRTFLDEIEPLSKPPSNGLAAPRDDQVGQWMSTLQAIFDSAARLILHQGAATAQDIGAERVLRLSSVDDLKTAVLAEDYSHARLLELACVAFAGLAIGDSGANLAQIQSYEEPADLQRQLAQPDRVNLTQKVVKFRAGGASVPVHLTTTTLSRLGTYLKIRTLLISHLNCPDIAPMFVQARFTFVKRWQGIEPLSVKALDNCFLVLLRSKVEAIGGKLPPITLRELRAFKQQSLVCAKGITVTSAVMGHSIATAVRSYCRAQEDVRRSGIGKFLASLGSRVLDAAKGDSEAGLSVSTPVGNCKNIGVPIPIESEALMQPTCDKTEGCFFCAQFRVHADELDLRKLLSCRWVLQRLAPLQGESIEADRVWVAITDRIDALLSAIGDRIPKVYESVRRDVEERANLTRYWTAKLQQLYLLGIVREPK